VTSAELFLAVSFAITAIASIGIPLYMRRKTAQQAEIDRLTSAAVAVAASEEVSWEAINRTIVQERNALKAEMKELASVHDDRIRELQNRFDSETQRLQERFDKENQRLKDQSYSEADRADRKIRLLSEEVDALQRKLAGGNS
jgi:hypothetical protein